MVHSIAVETLRCILREKNVTVRSNLVAGLPWALLRTRKRSWRRRATYVRRGGVGYFFGAYDVHADVLFGGYRLAKSTTEVLAFYQYIRRRSRSTAHLSGQRQPVVALDNPRSAPGLSRTTWNWSRHPPRPAI